MIYIHCISIFFIWQQFGIRTTVLADLCRWLSIIADIYCRHLTMLADRFPPSCNSCKILFKKLNSWYMYPLYRYISTPSNQYTKLGSGRPFDVRAIYWNRCIFSRESNFLKKKTRSKSHLNIIYQKCTYSMRKLNPFPWQSSFPLIYRVIEERRWHR